jgi:hypothetical protein
MGGKKLPFAAPGTKTAKYLAFAIAGGLVAVAAAVYAIDQNNRYGDVPCSVPAATSTPGGSAAAGFTSLHEIASNSEAIVVAKVDECEKVHSHPKSKDLRLTDVKVTVERQVSGSIPEGSATTVELVSSGSDADPHIMVQGERYVLFLAYNQITQSYFPVGGPQGRFQIVDGKVYSLDQLYPNTGFIQVKVDGQPLDEFLAAVKAAS